MRATEPLLGKNSQRFLARFSGSCRAANRLGPGVAFLWLHFQKPSGCLDALLPYQIFKQLPLQFHRCRVPLLGLISLSQRLAAVHTFFELFTPPVWKS